jgi:CheY-like chemotaxis protein
MLRGDHVIEVTASGVEALALLGNSRPAQFVLVDSQLADMNVFEFMRQAKAHGSAPKVVMIARLLTVRLLAAARAAGADYGIEKTRLQRDLPPLLCRALV